MVRVEKQNSFARNSTFRAQDLGFLALGFGFRALFVLVLCLGFWVWCLGFFGVFVMAVTCDSCCFGRNNNTMREICAHSVWHILSVEATKNRGWLAMIFEKTKQTRYTLYSKRMLFWLKGTTNMWEIKLPTGRVLRHAAVVFTVSCVCFGPVLWETHGHTGKQRHFVPVTSAENVPKQTAFRRT